MSEKRILITQGEHAASDDTDAVITTLLGSCVSVCLWDEFANVGGMNHMLLAVSETNSGISNLAGINAMEVLINDIIKLGGDRTRLKAKVFGGAQMIAGLSSVGRSNAAFALEFLENERIECVGQSIGGESARNLKFWPASGRVLQRIAQTPVPEEPPKVVEPEEGNDLELF